MTDSIFAFQLDEFEKARAAAEARQATWPRCACGAPADPSIGPRCDVCEEARRRANDILGRANIPKRYEWSSFESLDLAKRVSDAGAIERAKRWDGSDRLVLAGPRAGSGKTSLAVASARALVHTNPKIQSVLFVDAFALSQARGQFGAIADLVTRAKETSLLVLDDVGAEGKDPNRAIASVAFERHQHLRPMIITTGLTSADLDALYGSAIQRRLIEGAYIVKVNPPGVQAVKPTA